MENVLTSSSQTCLLETGGDDDMPPEGDTEPMSIRG